MAGRSGAAAAVRAASPRSPTRRHSPGIPPPNSDIRQSSSLNGSGGSTDAQPARSRPKASSTSPAMAPHSTGGVVRFAPLGRAIAHARERAQITMVRR